MSVSPSPPVAQVIRQSVANFNAIMMQSIEELDATVGQAWKDVVNTLAMCMVKDKHHLAQGPTPFTTQTLTVLEDFEQSLETFTPKLEKRLLHAIGWHEVGTILDQLQDTPDTLWGEKLVKCIDVLEQEAQHMSQVLKTYQEASQQLRQWIGTHGMPEVSRFPMSHLGPLLAGKAPSEDTLSQLPKHVQQFFTLLSQANPHQHQVLMNFEEGSLGNMRVMQRQKVGVWLEHLPKPLSKTTLVGRSTPASVSVSSSTPSL